MGHSCGRAAGLVLLAMLRVLNGNIFASERQTLVNAVNCVGVMGAGIALEFKLRYPAMFLRYESLCRQGRMEIGKLWLYKPDPGSDQPWVLNFPTKRHWRLPSKDDLIDSLKSSFRGVAARDLATLTGIEVRHVGAIQRALERSDVRSVSQLASTKGIGEKTLARAFAWVHEQGHPHQMGLGL